MPLFGGKHKTPHELVKIVRDGLVILSSGDTKDEKRLQKVTHLHNFAEHFLKPFFQYFVRVSIVNLCVLTCMRVWLVIKK